MPHSGADTNRLLDQASAGDRSAREQLLTRHREKLKRMVAVRLDRNLAARVDPSDVFKRLWPTRQFAHKLNGAWAPVARPFIQPSHEDSMSPRRVVAIIPLRTLSASLFTVFGFLATALPAENPNRAGAKSRD